MLKGADPTSSKLPQPDIHEGSFSDAGSLYMNPMLFLVAKFCSLNALRDYQGPEGLSKLLDVKAPPKEPIRIHWDPKVLSRPIFPGAKETIMTAGYFNKELREWGVRAGFPQPLSFHDFRAEGLSKIDATQLYSDTQRQMLAGHANNAIHHKYYAARNPGIDSQAAYLGMEARQIKIGELFGKLEVGWDPALWQTLPIAKQEELHCTAEYMDIRARLDDSKRSKKDERPDMVQNPLVKDEVLSLDHADSPLPDQPECLHPYLRLKLEMSKLEIHALKKFWRENQEQVVPGSQPYICRGVDHLFARLRPLLPLRARLADLLMLKTKLKSPEGRLAL
ncbi:putative C2H2-type domain-containing protein [Seiridium cardinale]